MGLGIRILDKDLRLGLGCFLRLFHIGDFSYLVLSLGDFVQGYCFMGDFVLNYSSVDSMLNKTLFRCQVFVQ